MSRSRRIGLPLGLVTFVAILVSPPPANLPVDGWRTAAVAALMAIWWVTEAIPIPATALAPLVLLPLLGVLEMPAATAPYANHLVFLQMGGFMIAAAMQSSGLHRRVALGVVSRVGTSPARLVLGFMIASAFLSMWISNTATTAMMLPIAIAVAELFRRDEDLQEFQFGICLMLGIAYASTLGGLATLIGTPPNAVLSAAADEILGVQIGFVDWMMVGLPLTLVMLPIVWLLLTRVLHPTPALPGDAAAVLLAQRDELGKPSRHELTVAAVFLVTASAWLLRAPKNFGGFEIPGIQTIAPFVLDSTIAIAAALALFVIPVDWRRGRFALDWDTAKRIPWGVLLLFGGGLSLADAMSRSGLAAWIGTEVAGLDFLPSWLILAVIATTFVFLTEITSNVATATMAMPVMAGAAAGLGLDPLTAMATAALSSSMAFMLPVATPPNAIVFGSGVVSIPQMARAGFLLNLLAIVCVTLAAVFLVPLLLK